MLKDTGEKTPVINRIKHQLYIHMTYTNQAKHESDIAQKIDICNILNISGISDQKNMSDMGKAILTRNRGDPTQPANVTF